MFVNHRLLLVADLREIERDDSGVCKAVFGREYLVGHVGIATGSQIDPGVGKHGVYALVELALHAADRLGVVVERLVGTARLICGLELWMSELVRAVVIVAFVVMLELNRERVI